MSWALTWTMVFDGRPYFFWPAFPIVAWGIAVVTHGFVAYGRVGHPKEAQIQRELKKPPHPQCPGLAGRQTWYGAGRLASSRSAKA